MRQNYFVSISNNKMTKVFLIMLLIMAITIVVAAVPVDNLKCVTVKVGCKSMIKDSTINTRQLSVRYLFINFFQ